MSAELYDAEMAGALARPAIDVLPTQHSRKGKEEIVAAGPADPAETAGTAEAEAAAPAAFATPEPPSAVASVEAPSVEAAPMVLAAELADEPAPRKVFGMTLGRSKRSKANEESAVSGEPQAAESDAVPSFAPEAVESTFEVAAEPAADFGIETPADSWADAVASPVAELTPEAAPVADHADESRALRSLLDASEQVRQVAEQRTAAAESEVRTLTNSVQEWQIRHREAESTITELAGSLAGAEGRMAELAQQLSAAQAERDELISQLEEATSPVNS